MRNDCYEHFIDEDFQASKYYRWPLDASPGAAMNTFTTSARRIEGSGSARFSVPYLCNALEFWQVTLCMTIVTYKMGTAMYSYKGDVMVSKRNVS